MSEPLPLAADESPPDWNEDLYQATCTVLVEPEKSLSARQSIGCLGVSLFLFVLSFLGSMDLRSLGFLIPILFLHEAGHFFGMRIFGYRNVRMFFIPFFGAAVYGKKHAVPAWQQAVVLLLGPLPGVCLGLALQLCLRPFDTGSLLGMRLVLWLVLVNGFNLLPIVPLDGGRLLDVLPFSRRPALALAFHLVAVVSLFALAVLLDWILGVIGGLLLLAAPFRYRKARLQHTFRNNPLELPERLEDLGDEQRRDLFGSAERLNPLSRNPVSLAGSMRSLHESMVSRQSGVFVGGLLTALYLGGVAASFAAGCLAYQDHTRFLQRAKGRTLASCFDAAVDEMNELRHPLRGLRVAATRASSSTAPA